MKRLLGYMRRATWLLVFFVGIAINILTLLVLFGYATITLPGALLLGLVYLGIAIYFACNEFKIEL